MPTHYIIQCTIQEYLQKSSAIYKSMFIYNKRQAPRHFAQICVTKSDTTRLSEWIPKTLFGCDF